MLSFTIGRRRRRRRRHTHTNRRYLSLLESYRIVVDFQLNFVDVVVTLNT